MTLHSDIWSRSVTGQSVEQIAADLGPAIDRAISGIEDKVQFVRACLENIKSRPDFAHVLEREPAPYVAPYPAWVPATEERHRDMEERYRSGESPAEIARSYGVTPSAIMHHLKRLGLVPVPKTSVKYNTVCPVPELYQLQGAWERRQALLRARRHGETLSDLGRSVGLSRERVRQMVDQAQREENKRSPIEKWMADQSYLAEVRKYV